MVATRPTIKGAHAVFVTASAAAAGTMDSWDIGEKYKHQDIVTQSTITLKSPKLGQYEVHST